MMYRFLILTVLLLTTVVYSQENPKPFFKQVTPNLVVKDVNATCEFYVGKLGFSTVLTIPDTGKFLFEMLKRDSVTVMFQDIESLKQGFPNDDIKPAAGSIILYIDITEFDELVDELKEKKVTIERYIPETFYGTREMVIRDNSGHFIVFAMDLERVEP